jgi:hypothetical protein
MANLASNICFGFHGRMAAAGWVSRRICGGSGATLNAGLKIMCIAIRVSTAKVNFLTNDYVHYTKRSFQFYRNHGPPFFHAIHFRYCRRFLTILLMIQKGASRYQNVRA